MNEPSLIERTDAAPTKAPRISHAFCPACVASDSTPRVALCGASCGPRVRPSTSSPRNPCVVCMDLGRCAQCGMVAPWKASGR